MAYPNLLAGRYLVGELLGSGGTADVHRGRDLVLGRDVAIKILRTDRAGDPEFQRRLFREVRNAASLHQPAIATVYDTGEERSPTGEMLPYIVMELVDGRALGEVLAGRDRPTPERALEIVADICAALDFGHRRGVLHRVKPGNVMLTPDGRVKLMDFGITGTPATGAVIDVQYMSPEQIGGQAADARSDVYTAGCLLYELLCGRPPFEGDNPVSVAYQHVRDAPRRPSVLNPDLSPDIDTVVLKALEKDPRNRYQSAGDMAADLRRAAADLRRAAAGRPVTATRWAQRDISSQQAGRAQPAPAPPTGPAPVPPARPAPVSPAQPAPAIPTPRPEPPGYDPLPTYGVDPQAPLDHAPLAGTQPARALDQLVAESIREAVTNGLVILDIPGVMRQGTPERVRVAVARTLDLEGELRALLRERGASPLERIKTSPFMAVDLDGVGFEIRRIVPSSDSRQLVAPMAIWDFSVVPLRSGIRQLLVVVTLRVPMPGRSDEQMAIPVLERLVKVRVDVMFTSRRFVGQYWQWIIATGMGLGGAIAAWQKLFN